MSFGNKLKQLRRQNDLSQQQMSEKLHIEQSTYSRYETGKAVPNGDIIMRVANIFNVTPDWLMQPENNHITFEGGSANNVTAVINQGTQQNIYYVPKEMMDSLINQQKLLVELLQKLMDKL